MHHGGKTEVELGFDDFQSYYRKDSIYGALVGRYVGRISHGGSFPLNGKIHQLEKRDPAAKNVIHGGTAGFHNKVWAAEIRNGVEPSLILTLESPDGDGGFPGALATTVTYTVTKYNELKVEYHAEAIGGPTVANLTNHSYFALQGEGKGDISDQTLQVFADKYTPADIDNLETGEILPVEGTPLDFRKPVRLGNVLHSSFPQIAMREGLDINMVINGKPGTLRPAARLSDPHTGIVMDVLTTQPCMQLYSDGIGERTVTGKGGKERHCPLWPSTAGELRDLIAHRSPEACVFLNRCGHPVTRFGIHTLVERYVRRVQVTMPSLATKRISPHTIRHTTATHLLRAGVDINTVRAWLGHVSLDTTNIYAEIDLEMKAKALAKCEVTETNMQKRHWRDDPALMTFLRAL